MQDEDGPIKLIINMQLDGPNTRWIEDGGIDDDCPPTVISDLSVMIQGKMDELGYDDDLQAEILTMIHRVEELLGVPWKDNVWQQ